MLKELGGKRIKNIEKERRIILETYGSLSIEPSCHQKSQRQRAQLAAQSVPRQQGQLLQLAQPARRLSGERMIGEYTSFSTSIVRDKRRV